MLKTLRILLVGTGVLAGCFVPLAAQTLTDPKLGVEIVVSGIPSIATSMIFIGDDDILVCEKNSGRVRRVTAGVLDPTPVLDTIVNTLSERGLLGIARDPRFLLNRYVYLYLTEAATVDGGIPIGNRVYRYTWNGTILVDPLLILDLPVTNGPNHDGGIVDFGPDDRLYAIIGDLNRNGKLENFELGLSPDDTAVITRTDGFGNALPDNPFYDATDPANPLGRYFAYGVRNSFGFTFDPVTGDLWDTENGPQEYDEINRFDPGANSGWEALMGPDSRDPQGVVDLWYAPGSYYADPLFSWLRTIAPTAIAFAESAVTGCDNRLDLIVGDNNCGQLYKFELTADRKGLVLDGVLTDRVADNSFSRCSSEQEPLIFGTGFGVVTDIENGPDGALYVVSGFAGRIYRIAPVKVLLDDLDGDRVEDACDCAVGDGSAYDAPVEVPRLRLAPSLATWLGWDPQSATAGVGTEYTVVSGSLVDLRRDSGFDRTCVVEDGVADPQLFDARSLPDAGDAYYYLVRAGNNCDAGTYGDGGTVPDPRDVLDAAMPAFCTR